jgi:dTDP-4-dehydrorhamnose 3,5-epimerase
LEPNVYEDQRGYFFESYNQDKFRQEGLDLSFVQDNQSKSQKGVLRGLHFQNPPFAQGKLVQVIKGAVLDVAVDIRKDSPTYGQHLALELSEENKMMLYISEGFAHGFLTLKDETIFSYKCTNFYNPDYESALRWDDEKLNVNWNVNDPIVSEKDQKAMIFAEFKSQF